MAAKPAGALPGIQLSIGAFRDGNAPQSAGCRAHFDRAGGSVELRAVARAHEPHLLLVVRDGTARMRADGVEAEETPSFGLHDDRRVAGRRILEITEPATGTPLAGPILLPAGFTVAGLVVVAGDGLAVVAVGHRCVLAGVAVHSARCRRAWTANDAGPADDGQGRRDALVSGEEGGAELLGAAESDPFSS